jgi:AraC family transcriptional regulator
MDRLVPVASRDFFEDSGLEVRREIHFSQLRLRDLSAARSVTLPRHRRGEAHIAMLLRGTMACSCRSAPYEPWIGVFHPPGFAHQVQLRRAVLVELELGEPWLDRLGEHLPAPTGTVVLDGQSRFVATRLVHEFRHLQPASLLVLEGLTAQLLAFAARAEEEATPPGEPPWLRPLVGRLEADFTRHVQVNELAAEFQVHPGRLTKLFRLHTGGTVAEFVRQLRVRYVMERLATGDEPLVDLALGAGFADQSHCTREFKRATGETPAAYRRLLRRGAPGAESRGAEPAAGPVVSRA